VDSYLSQEDRRDNNLSSCGCTWDWWEQICSCSDSWLLKNIESADWTVRVWKWRHWFSVLWVHRNCQRIIGRGCCVHRRIIQDIQSYDICWDRLCVWEHQIESECTDVSYVCRGERKLFNNGIICYKRRHCGVSESYCVSISIGIGWHLKSLGSCIHHNIECGCAQCWIKQWRIVKNHNIEAISQTAWIIPESDVNAHLVSFNKIKIINAYRGTPNWKWWSSNKTGISSPRMRLINAIRILKWCMGPWFRRSHINILAWHSWWIIRSCI
jgi:hypothetical protein